MNNRGRAIKIGLILGVVVVLVAVFLFATSSGGVGASSDPKWVNIDQILGISVDTDADGQPDYLITVTQVKETFRTENGFVTITLAGDVNELRPLP